MAVAAAELDLLVVGPGGVDGEEARAQHAEVPQVADRRGAPGGPSVGQLLGISATCIWIRLSRAAARSIVPRMSESDG